MFICFDSLSDFLSGLVCSILRMKQEQEGGGSWIIFANVVVVVLGATLISSSYCS
jgi:hypothetical protein